MGSPGRRRPLDIIVDRPSSEAALALGAAWLAFVAALVLGREVEDPASLAVGAAAGALLVFLGFAAASRCRTLSPRHPARLALLSLAAGTVLGLANLGANLAIAGIHPGIRAVLTDRMVAVERLEGLIASPIIEEIVVRLFLMSLVAWLVFRLTKRPAVAFAVALAGSALFFALLHLDRAMPEGQTLASAYRVALVTKYTLAGVPLGWIFWRWGLPYAILCHVAANAAHLAIQAAFF